MQDQNYKNHVRFYAPHHFIFYPVIIAGIIISATCINSDESNSNQWKLITALFVLLGWLSFMMRQHYALGNQNRIIRMEMRFRYYVLTGERLEPLEDRLSFSQIAALRFASDEELAALITRTLKENLSGGDIKKSIKNWQPDHMRA